MLGKRKRRASFAHIDDTLRTAYEELLPHLSDKRTGKLYVELIPPNAYLYFHFSWNREFSEWSKQRAERVAPKRGLKPYPIIFENPSELRNFFRQVD